VGQGKVTVEAEGTEQKTEQGKSVLDLVGTGVYNNKYTNDLTHMKGAKNTVLSCVFTLQATMCCVVCHGSQTLLSLTLSFPISRTWMGRGRERKSTSSTQE